MLPNFWECRLRGVWKAFHQPPLLPSSPAARLGSIIHRLLEEAGRGAFTPPTGPNGAEARFIQLVAENEQIMAKRPLESRFVPLKEHIPKFEVLRIRALARADDLSAELHGSKASAAEGAGAPYGFELPVESADGLIAGQIDRALPTPGGVVLQDYKSGAIFSAGPGAEHEVKPEYALQLRLYAALYKEKIGKWPSNLQLVPLSGEPHDVSFSPDECLRLLDEARAIIGEANEDIARCGGDSDALESLLASPSPSACRFCPYRPACRRYMSHDLPADDPGWPADVWGTLEDLTRLGNGNFMLSVKIQDGSVVFVRDIADPALEDADLSREDRGVAVGVFNAKRTGSPRAFEARPLTSIVKSEISPVGLQ